MIGICTNHPSKSTLVNRDTFFVQSPILFCICLGLKLIDVDMVYIGIRVECIHGRKQWFQGSDIYLQV